MQSKRYTWIFIPCWTLCCMACKAFEPSYDKTNKMTVRSAKIQISLGIRPVWSEISLSAWRNLASLATHSAHSEDWSDWAYAQADSAQSDLRLRWVHNRFVCFVVMWLIYSELHVFFCSHFSFTFYRILYNAETGIMMFTNETNLMFLSQNAHLFWWWNFPLLASLSEVIMKGGAKF